MEPDQKYAGIGLFVIVTVAGLLGFALWINGYLERKDKVCYLMRFNNSVAGLNQGSAITFRGVNIGQVDGIRISPNDNTQILVRAFVDERTPIHANTMAQLKPQGITGASYIELDVKPGPKPTVRPSTRFENCHTIETLPSNIEQIVNTLPRILDRTLDVANRLSEVLDAENTANFKQVLVNMNALVKKLDQTATTLGPDMKQAMEEMRKSMENLNRLSGKLDTSADGNIQGLQEAVRQTTAAMAEVKRLTESLRVNPQRTIFSPDVNEEKIP